MEIFFAQHWIFFLGLWAMLACFFLVIVLDPVNRCVYSPDLLPLFDDGSLEEEFLCTDLIPFAVFSVSYSLLQQVS